MSETLTEATDFLNLFLNTTKQQAKGLLKSGTSAQINALSEIAFNLLIVSVPKDIKKKINKCRKLFKKLGTKRLSTRTKIKLILSQFSLFLSILMTLKPLILELISP